MRPRSRQTDMRPGLLWFSLTLFLLAIAGAGFLIVNTLMGEWLDLKLESARVRVLEAMPQPERPEFVPTPIFAARKSVPPTAVVQVMVVPNETVSAQATEQAAIPAATPISNRVPAPQSSQVENNSAPPVAIDTSGLAAMRPAVELTGVIHEAQRFNNCGPTTLRMLFSYFGYRQDSQVQIANVLKPNKDDRNVSPDELTGYAEGKGFRALTRVNGTLERLKTILSNDLPVMIEEGYNPPRANSGWMGHYILLTGYDTNGIIAQDSYNGPNQRVAWNDVDDHWRDFNRTYIVIYPPEKEGMIQAILGEDNDTGMMYAKAAQRAQEEWDANPQDPFAAFNLGSSLVGTGDYAGAADAFDQARQLKLPWRMMWYQFGPYEAYYHVGRYEEIVALADATLKPTGDLEESYYWKGLALQKLGRIDQARKALQQALRYNANYAAAQQALAELGS